MATMLTANGTKPSANRGMPPTAIVLAGKPSGMNSDTMSGAKKYIISRNITPLPRAVNRAMRKAELTLRVSRAP